MIEFRTTEKLLTLNVKVAFKAVFKSVILQSDDMMLHSVSAYAAFFTLSVDGLLIRRM